jgi:ABC-type transport system involved in cytochrome c biogenesis ATPase subunit
VTASPLMTVRSIGKAFGGEWVLADVSFEVASGEILGLIGPNGAGKTTLLECIAGLLPSDAGEVRWRGCSLPQARRKEQLFYVPEAISPYPDQRTMEVLKFFREAYRQPPGRLQHLVHALGLEPALRKPVDALSKGYRRRFLLALGLLAPRPVLLMDEPFDGFRSAPNTWGNEPVATGGGGWPCPGAVNPPTRRRSAHMRPARAPQRRPRDGGRHLGGADSGYPIADRHRSGRGVPCAHMNDARP